jgi:putative tryptophan/tyrosine transport system substrate-binding protein
LTVLRARWRLRGVKPEDIPVEEPAKFDLVVNLKTAKAIALTMPESLLTRADEVCRPSSCPSAVEASPCSGVL